MTEQPEILQNRTSIPTCLIFRTRTVGDGLVGELDMWSDQTVEVGTRIQSNLGLMLRLTDDSHQYQSVRDLEITRIVSRENFNGHWDYDKEKKNLQSKYTVQVKPYTQPIA